MNNVLKKIARIVSCFAILLFVGTSLTACGKKETPPADTSTHIETFDGLKTAVAKGGEITLDKDITFTAENEGDMIVVKKDTTINLNGKKIKVDSTAHEEDLFTVDGATLTLTGNGEIEGKDCYIVTVQKTEKSKAVIKNGTYKVTDCATVVHTFGGKVVIEGGTFSNTPEAGKSYGHKYLINIQDDVADKTGVVVITGGKFEEFDPTADGDVNFVPSTHEAKKDAQKNVWTVVAK